MENEQVEYRTVEGHEGYRVGSDGSVWSRWRMGREHRRDPDGKRWSRSRWAPDGEWRRLKPIAFDKLGHLKVTLQGGKQRQVHRLVCAAFHGPPPTPRHEAAHLDGDPANCRADNLAWKTRKENAADMVRHGTVCLGEKHGWHKLTEAAVRLMRERHAAGAAKRALAREFGVSQMTVIRVLPGRSWGWLE
jgi:hypothetical protein